MSCVPCLIAVIRAAAILPTQNAETINSSRSVCVLRAIEQVSEWVGTINHWRIEQNVWFFEFSRRFILIIYYYEPSMLPCAPIHEVCISVWLSVWIECYIDWKRTYVKRAHICAHFNATPWPMTVDSMNHSSKMLSGNDSRCEASCDIIWDAIAW